ncbi:hypothetical protein H072_3021 [Dactylellina haptotyla CBS 200.50]|uniref:Uncharacterized protein n=1 Tax=Dactylellina haptotyla (strain CBS 200.50) TaxID=1284197 RepID=S8AJ30_DACHA|nr:hypothetical protein H072_3021 [Dactylellina haptotyla CBS 200.50]
MSLHYLPPVKPSAIALGTVFTQLGHTAVLAPLFGDRYERAKKTNASQNFLHSKEAKQGAVLFGTTLLGSSVQTYAMAALITTTGTLSYKGAAYLGTLVFFSTSLGATIGGLIGFGEPSTRPVDITEVVAGATSSLLDTVGLAMVLNWWGVRTIESF